MKAIVKGVRIDPKQSLMEMITSHKDDQGRTWAKGTLYQPSSSGKAGGLDYQDVEILPNGEYARFIA